MGSRKTAVVKFQHKIKHSTEIFVSKISEMSLALKKYLKISDTPLITLYLFGLKILAIDGILAPVSFCFFFNLYLFFFITSQRRLPTSYLKFARHEERTKMMEEARDEKKRRICGETNGRMKSTIVEDRYRHYHASRNWGLIVRHWEAGSVSAVTHSATR